MSWITSNKFYESGEKPKFEVGQRIIIQSYTFYITSMRVVKTRPIRAEVVSVSDKKSGLFWKEFTYTVKELESGKVRTNMYESELGIAEGKIGYYDIDSTHMDYVKLIAAIPRSLDIDAPISFYEDNVLEITYDSDTDTFSLWVDPEYTSYAKLGVLLNPVLLRGKTDDETFEICHKYIYPVIYSGISYLGKGLWTAKDPYTLLSRFHVFEECREEFQEANKPTKKVYRFHEDPTR